MLEDIITEFAAIVLSHVDQDMDEIDSILAKPKMKKAVTQLASWLHTVAPTLTDEVLDDGIDFIWE